MGSGKRQHVGWRYYYGLHWIPCRKADAVLAVKMAEKLVWEGDQGDGYITIDDTEAFGGDEREGGFSGNIAVMLGSASQLVNPYLQTIMGTLTPAFRGVASMIFERPYFNANSARLPALQVKLVNIEDIHKGWLPEKCVIDAAGVVSTAAIYIAMDTSGSMATGGKLETQATALAAFVLSMKGRLNSIKVVAYNATIAGQIERFDCTDDDYEDIAVWIESYSALAVGGDWNAAVSQAAAFFEADDTVERSFAQDLVAPTLPPGFVFGGEVEKLKRRLIIFTSDGAPAVGTPELAAATIAAIGGVEVFAFNIEDADTTEAEKIDNTSVDGVPVVSGSDPGGLKIALASAFRSWVDLNPAHIQRCLLIDPLRGGTATADQIGDSFEAAADRYLLEGFGLSVRFNGAEANLQDRAEIDRHCDAITYFSRRTGKWEHKPVRDDFVFDDLPVLDGAVVKDWSGLRRPKVRELPNKMTLIYTDRTSGATASVTRSNPVARRAAGRTIVGPDVTYASVTIPSLADRICLRDLTAIGTPLLAGDLPLSYLPANFELGSAVRLSSTDPLIGDVAVRITEIRHGAGMDASVWLKVVEHRFELGSGIALTEAEPIVIDDRASAATVRRVDEAPYYVILLEVGQSTLDDELSGTPDLGRILAAAAAPNARHLEAVVGVDAGGGWTEEGVFTFSPTTTTTAALSAQGDATQVRVAITSSLNRVTVNQLAWIGPEIVRVDAMAEDAGEIILTLGRGCLDTAPQSHAPGSSVIFFGPGQPMGIDYVDGEVVDVKLLPRTATALLSIAAAPVDTVTFASRAIRPYPPGRLKINASYANDQVTSDVALSWAHRDRTLQTTLVPEDHDATGIGPEVGTTYRVIAEALDAIGTVLATVTDTNVGGVTSFDWNDATVLPVGTVRLRFSVVSVRNTYESWQRPTMTALLLLPPGDLTAEVL